MIHTKDLPIDNEYPLSCVYWIYDPARHFDPKTSGYVGVSVRGAAYRFKQHLRNAKNNQKTVLSRAILKYDLAVKILILATPELCLLVEEELRPLPNMLGTWNISKGGIAGRLGSHHTEEARLKIKKANKNKKFSECTLERMSKAQTGKKKSLESRQKHSTSITTESKHATSLRMTGLTAWRHTASNKIVWSKAFELYDKFKVLNKATVLNLARVSGYTDKSLVTIFNKFKQGWIPENDLEYVKWLIAYKQEFSNA